MRRVSAYAVSLLAAAWAAGLALTLPASPAAARETCWTGRHAQFFNAIHYCVSSVLPPQGINSYGPENLTRMQGSDSKAWCEGAPGPGIGETITIHIEGAAAFRRLLVGNGYIKSPQTYLNNGRIRTVEIATEMGVIGTVDFPDTGEIVPVDLPQMVQNSIQLKIVDVYPGARFADTCLNFITPDFEYEEELLLKQQGLMPDK